MPFVLDYPKLISFCIAPNQAPDSVMLCWAEIARFQDSCRKLVVVVLTIVFAARALKGLARCRSPVIDESGNTFCRIVLPLSSHSAFGRSEKAICDDLSAALPKRPFPEHRYYHFDNYRSVSKFWMGVESVSRPD